MKLLDELREISLAERLIDVERREKGSFSEGDFAGSVPGSWVRLDQSGAGVVSYQDKEYFTDPIGFISVPKGTVVELSFADGIYYSKF